MIEVQLYPVVPRRPSCAIKAIKATSMYDSPQVASPNGPPAGPRQVLGPFYRVGYVAHKRQRPPLAPPFGPRHNPIVGSKGGAVSYE